MYLIDTSIWIDYLKNNENESIKKFNAILDNRIPFGITGLIYQEILQGAASINDFHKLRDYLSTQRFFNSKDTRLTHEAAANLYFLCRKKGITIRSTVDCYIAQIAIEYELTLLHNDKDFAEISNITPLLKCA
jgi:predicted nucleic acid-binding protein